MVLKFKTKTGKIIEEPTCGCKCSVLIKGDITMVEMISRCKRHKK